MKLERRIWAEVDLDALGDNYRTLRREGSLYMAVVKANAYGHGDVPVARELERLGADWFGVATVQEGMSLREGGITRPILILGYTPVAYTIALDEYDLTQALFSVEYGQALEEAAAGLGIHVKCHLKIDSGMNRLGFDARREDLEEQVRAALGPHLELTGTFTHFAVADELGGEQEAFTREQFHRFRQACARLEKAGFSLGLRYCANSAASLRFPEMAMDMVREGIAQYGLSPSREMARSVPQLRPILSLHSTVAMVKTVLPGDTISYGRRFTAQEPRQIATIPVGYADGYARILGGRGKVLIHGCPAPVVGRVCMDQMMVDVTGLPPVKMGDQVVLVGQDGEETITFDQLAQLADTISYECVCAIAPRVPRLYVRK